MGLIDNKKMIRLKKIIIKIPVNEHSQIFNKIDRPQAHSVEVNINIIIVKLMST